MGGKLLISAGTFNIAAPIVPGTGHTIQGAGFYATTLKLAASANCNVIAVSDDNTHRYGMAIRDLTIDGNKANNASGNGISVYAMWFCSLTNLNIVSCAGKGIYFGDAGDNGQQAYLEKIKVQYCDDTGIDVAYGSCSDSVIKVANVNSCGMITGYNVYIGSSNWQVYSLNASVSPADLVNVRVDGSDFGVTFYGLTVDDDEAGATGLQFFSSNAWNYHSKVIGGYILNQSVDTHTGYGISCAYGGTKQVQNPTFDKVRISGYAYGVRFSGPLIINPKVINCVFESQAIDPILDSGATNPIIYGNTGYIHPDEYRTHKDELATDVFPAHVYFEDQDDMASDRDDAVPSQQSVKAYVDNNRSGGDCLKYLFDTDTDSSPAAGRLQFNSATSNLVTHIYISQTDADGNDVGAFLDDIDDSEAIAVRAMASPGTDWWIGIVTSFSDTGTEYDLTVSWIAYAGGDPPFGDGDSIMFCVTRVSDEGYDYATAGTAWDGTRDVAPSKNAARDILEYLGDRVGEKMQRLSDDATPALGGPLAVGANGIVLTKALSSDHTYSGPVVAGVAGENVNFGSGVYQKFSDNEWYLWDKDAEATTDAQLGIVVTNEAKGDGEAITVAMPGCYVRDDTWAFDETKQYVGDSGAPADHTAALSFGTGDFVRRIGTGFNISSTYILHFNPAEDYGELT